MGLELGPSLPPTPAQCCCCSGYARRPGDMLRIGRLCCALQQLVCLQSPHSHDACYMGNFTTSPCCSASIRFPCPCGIALHDESLRTLAAAAAEDARVRTARRAWPPRPKPRHHRSPSTRWQVSDARFNVCARHPSYAIPRLADWNGRRYHMRKKLGSSERLTVGRA
eukprot:SAG11_NODE_890_length_6689_cov_18.947951_9_plen_167_part_00